MINQTLATIKKESPILYWAGLINIVFLIISLLGLLIDDRMVMGINSWIKPIKFSISTGIYILTIGFLFSIYPYSSSKKTIVGRIVAWTLSIEMIIILFQASRAVQSHYNMQSPLDGILFAIMGIFVGINVLIMVMFFIDTLRFKLNASSTTRIAIIMGWAVVIIGSWVGGQMISQMAHNVGVADGGEGLPLLNWSTKAGDLRIAHFFGLHGIQIIPIASLWIQNKLGATSRSSIILTVAFGILYAALIGFTFYQAKQGIPLIEL